MKGGPEGDASAFLIVAENQHYPALPRGLIILDWFTSEARRRRPRLALHCRPVYPLRPPRHRARNIFIEDTGLGSHLLRANEELGTTAFDPGRGRARQEPAGHGFAPFVNRGEVKLTRAAY
jgi:hypothetical protein